MALVGVVAGVNVKLIEVRRGGPGAARCCGAHGSSGFKVMLGCMEETSVAIAAAAALASLADWVDLDGNLLLAHDPFEGLELGADCRWRWPTEPGLGLSGDTADGSAEAPREPDPRSGVRLRAACGQGRGQVGGWTIFRPGPPRPTIWGRGPDGGLRATGEGRLLGTGDGHRRDAVV